MGNYDIEAIRKKLDEKKGNRFKDPNEFKPTQPKEGDIVKYRFYVLPPLQKGDVCAEGTAANTMEMFYVLNGSHWINSRPYPCPRVHDDADCPLCDFAFDMMNDAGDNKERKREIAKSYLPRSQYAMNIYFLNSDSNPEDLRGRVMWYNPSKQVYEVMEKALMNQNEGDPADPQACGVFFDENGAYIFQLEVTKSEGYISYIKSKFLANTGKRPIVAKKNADGKLVAVPEKIKEILDSRFDVTTKFAARDHDALKGLVRGFLNEDSGTKDDSGFTDDEPVSANVVGEDVSAEEPVVAKTQVKTISKPATKQVKIEEDVTEEELANLINDIDSE